MASRTRTRDLAAVPLPALRRGERLLKYRIERRLGEGRFATVYRAYDTIEGVRVALKVFAERSPAAQNVFAHEARIAALLEHDNIVRLKTAEMIGGHGVLVTELGEGPSPRHSNVHVRCDSRCTFYIKCCRSRFRPRRASSTSDIKPENILCGATVA